MEKEKLLYCIFYKDTLDTIYTNINYAMNHIANKKDCVIKPKLLNSSLNFETIYFNHETNKIIISLTEQPHL